MRAVGHQPPDRAEVAGRRQTARVDHEDRIGQGRENAKKYLKEHPDVAIALEQQLRHTLGLTPAAAEPSAGADPHAGPLDLETDHA